MSTMPVVKANVILVHGIFGQIIRNSFGRGYFRDVKSSIEGQALGPGFDIRVSEPNWRDGYSRDRAHDVLELLERDSAALHSDAKTIFLCHSQGGIVTKHALSIIASDSAFPNISKLLASANTRHVLVSIGTPHRGTPVAALGAIVSSELRGVPLSDDNLLITVGKRIVSLLRGHPNWAAIQETLTPDALDEVAKACQSMLCDPSEIRINDDIDPHPAVDYFCVGNNQPPLHPESLSQLLLWAAGNDIAAVHENVLVPSRWLINPLAAHAMRLAPLCEVISEASDSAVPYSSADWVRTIKVQDPNSRSRAKWLGRVRSLYGVLPDVASGFSSLDHLELVGHRFTLDLEDMVSGIDDHGIDQHVKRYRDLVTALIATAPL